MSFSASFRAALLGDKLYGVLGVVIIVDGVAKSKDVGVGVSQVSVRLGDLALRIDPSGTFGLD